MWGASWRVAAATGTVLEALALGTGGGSRLACLKEGPLSEFTLV